MDKQTDSLFDAEFLHNLRYPKTVHADPVNYQFIDSVRYKPLINQVCKDLHLVGGIRNFSACLNFNDIEKYYLSNDPGGIAIPYFELKYFKIDDIFSLQRCKDSDFFFPGEQIVDPLQKLFLRILEEQYGVYNTYAIVRRSEECTLILVAGHNHRVEDPKQLYKRTVGAFEDFAVNFFDHTMGIISSHKNCLKYLRIVSDRRYRQDVIKGKLKYFDYIHPEKITERQIGCLQWARKGKSAHEIAAILELSTNTVTTHLKQAKELLNAENIAQATYKARQLGLIV